MKKGYEEKTIEVDLVVVGAGFPGIAAAIQGARKGLKVALINDRGVLGGNGGAEIGVPANGSSDGGALNLHSREGGIISEIQQECNNRQPLRYNRNVVDGVLVDFVDREENIQVYLNTCIDEIEVTDNVIQSVSGTQNTTEIRWHFSGQWFVDDTGDGTLGAMAGAEYMIGRESKDTFGEHIAGEEADDYVIPSTLNFHAYDLGYKVPFKAPDCAIDIPGSGALERRLIPRGSCNMYQWFYEVGGDYDHVKDKETIIKEHKKLIWGIWDYVKNSGEYPEADNFDIEYMSTIPGTREYRRLVGDYILTEKDIILQTDHEDTVGHGGWNIDLHAIKGFFDDDLINRHIHFSGVYKIPYRTCYSKTITNMFMCGRCMSTSHVAFGSTRVIATLTTVGQAVGMAAYLCKKYKVMPRDIYKYHIKELQQALLKEDQLLIGVRNEDAQDLALKADVSASSTATLVLDEAIKIDRDQWLIDDGMEHLLAHFKATETKNQNDAVTMSAGKVRYHRYDGYSDGKQLDTGLALSLPIKEGIDGIELLIRSKSETLLKYHIYLPKVPENYGPDVCVYSGEIAIGHLEDFEWVRLPLECDAKDTYMLIQFDQNEAVCLGIGGEALPNTMMFGYYENKSTNVVEYETMKMAERLWDRAPLSVCYRTLPEQKVYSASNVTNGYNRAYKQPNMWLSAKNDPAPSLTLKWSEAKTISKLQVTFAIDTTKRLRYDYFKEVFDCVAYDYKVFANMSGKKHLICEVKDNYNKINRLSFEAIETDCLMIEFGESNTNQIGVYEIRAYE